MGGDGRGGAPHLSPPTETHPTPPVGGGPRRPSVERIWEEEFSFGIPESVELSGGRDSVASNCTDCSSTDEMSGIE